MRTQGEISLKILTNHLNNIYRNHEKYEETRAKKYFELSISESLQTIAIALTELLRTVYLKNGRENNQ